MPKTYEQLVREQQNILGRPAVSVPSLVDGTAPGDEDEDDRRSCTSGLTEGPELDAGEMDQEEDPDLEIESVDPEAEVDITLFQNYREINVNLFI